MSIMKGFTPKAVEAIQSTLGLTLTQEQIDKGSVKFPVHSRWSWKNTGTNSPMALICRGWADGVYRLSITQFPGYGLPSYPDWSASATTALQLKRACEDLKNY